MWIMYKKQEFNQIVQNLTEFFQAMEKLHEKLENTYTLEYCSGYAPQTRQIKENNK